MNGNPSDSAAAPGSGRIAKPVISVVLPTYNENANLIEAIRRIDGALKPTGLAYDLTVVDDDSPDGTWATVEELMGSRPDLHLIRRVGRRGLSSAIVEGLQSARGEWLVVMDADLQHDAAILPQLEEAARAGAALVVATRYAHGGQVGTWSLWRWLLSRTATVLSRLVIRTPVSDPMSGYFLITRAAFTAVAGQLDPRGFKILLEIIARSPRLAVREVGFHFAKRVEGESKLDRGVALAYVRALYDLSIGRVLPLRFVLYSLVGASGVVVNLGMVMGLRAATALGSEAILIIAICTAMVSNFLLNNVITFADQRQTSVRALLRALVLFITISTAGAVLNYAIGMQLHGYFKWPLPVADLVGIIFAAVWNYSLNRNVTWSEKR